jgi:LAO/AO transport system kinase
VLQGSAQAVARLISLVENHMEQAVPELRTLYPHTGRASVVGVTGPPGAGKSTLVNALVREIRLGKRRVGVVAIDPTSPFTGGAILGDRIRMQDHSADPGVFVRSMATRGRLGGLAPATDIIFIETVGAGQGEVEIAGAADTVLLVTVPTLGDSVQTLKAGIMEIGDIFIVNKADRGDADRTAMEIKAMLGLAPQHSGWRPPVLLAAATESRGIAEILAAVDAHRHYLVARGLLIDRRKVRRRQEILEVVEDRLLARVGGDRVDALATRVAEGGLDPYTAADELLGRTGIR